MNTLCSFCYTGPLLGHTNAAFAPPARQASVRNQEGYLACERHIEQLWTLTAHKRHMYLTGKPL